MREIFGDSETNKKTTLVVSCILTQNNQKKKISSEHFIKSKPSTISWINAFSQHDITTIVECCSLKKIMFLYISLPTFPHMHSEFVLQKEQQKQIYIHTCNKCMVCTLRFCANKHQKKNFKWSNKIPNKNYSQKTSTLLSLHFFLLKSKWKLCTNYFDRPNFQL